MKTDGILEKRNNNQRNNTDDSVFLLFKCICLFVQGQLLLYFVVAFLNQKWKKKKNKNKNVFKTSAKPSYFFVTEPSISSAHYQIEFLDDSVAIKMVKTKFLASWI